MAFYLVSGRLTPTNTSLLGAFRGLGMEAALFPPSEVVRRARPGDLALARLDVAPTLDGIEPGFWELRRLRRTGAEVLNEPAALITAHDKLATALRLAAWQLPHPRTSHIGSLAGTLSLQPPVVVKPRFGSWGRDVVLCADEGALAVCLARLARRPWFRRHGALVQELIEPRGYDLRLVVAAGTVVGAVERVAAPGEWRTNIALGGHRRPVVPPPEACQLAVAAADAIGADLVGVDLLPDDQRGWVVLELNGAVDFTSEYSLDGSDVFDEVARLLAVPRALPAVVSAAS